MRRVLTGAPALVGTAVVGGALLVAGCSSGGSSSSPSAAGGASTATAAAAAPVTVRLGYLANITHAPALLAVKNGYFTKELDVARTSIVAVRDANGQVRAFHNICRHRANKLVWTDFPRRETFPSRQMLPSTNLP